MEQLHEPVLPTSQSNDTADEIGGRQLTARDCRWEADSDQEGTRLTRITYANHCFQRTRQIIAPPDTRPNAG